MAITGQVKNHIHQASDISLESNLSENGYAKLPGGLLIQWGKLEVSQVNRDKTQIFPIPFKQIFQISEFQYYPKGSWMGNMSAGATLKSYNNTQFVCQLHDYEGYGKTPSYVLWTAIGTY